MKQLIVLSIVLVLSLSQQIKVDKKTLNYVDEKQKVRVFHGVNVVYKKKPYVPVETLKFDPLYSFSMEDVKNLKKWGLNVIRLFVSWEATEAVRGEYNMTYIQALKNIVQMCESEGIYVILDGHQDVISPYFCGEGFPDWAVHVESFPSPHKFTLRRDGNGLPLEKDCLERPFWNYYFTDDVYQSFKNLYENKNGIRDSFGDFWRMIAANFKNYKNVLGYEIINEPFAGSIKKEPSAIFWQGLSDKKYLYPFYQIIFKKIREEDNEKIIFFDNYEFDQIAVGFTKSPEGPEYNDRQSFSIHLYCPLLDGNGEPKNEFICDIIHAHHYKIKTRAAKKMGTGVFLTEFGSQAQTPKGLREINHVLKKADASFMSWAYWQFKFLHDVTSTTIPAINEGLYDSEGLLQTQKLKLLSRPYLPEICGQPIYANYDVELTFAKFEYSAGQCSDSTSLLYVNEELFNNGSSIDIAVTQGVLIKKVTSNYYQLIHDNTLLGKKIAIEIKGKK